MAANPLVLINSIAGFGALDLTDTASRVELELTGDTQVGNTFGAAGWKANYPGLASATLTGEGEVNFGVGLLDERLFATIETPSPIPVTFAPERNPGDVALLVEMLNSKYTPGAPVGTLMRYSISADSAAEAGNDASVGHGNILGVDADGGNASTVTTSAVTFAEAARIRMFVHILGTGNITPSLEWTRNGGGASGSVAGSVVAAPGYSVFDVAWPDPGNSIDVHASLAAAGANFGYIVAAAPIA